MRQSPSAHLGALHTQGSAQFQIPIINGSIRAGCRPSASSIRRFSHTPSLLPERTSTTMPLSWKWSLFQKGRPYSVSAAFFVSFSPDALVNVTHRQAPHSPLTDRDIRRLLRCLERLKYKLEFSWRKNPQHAPPKVVTPTRCLASCHSSVRGYLYRPPPSLWFAAKTQFHSCTL